MRRRRFVLLAAVARYAGDAMPRLPGVQRDAERLRSTLEQYTDGVYRTYWLCDGRATRADMLRSLAEIVREAGATDQVLIYFAGHGWRDRDPSGRRWAYYLMPHDATPASAATQGVAVDDLQATLGGLAAQELVVILDC